MNFNSFENWKHEKSLLHKEDLCNEFRSLKYMSILRGSGLHIPIYQYSLEVLNVCFQLFDSVVDSVDITMQYIHQI